METKKYISLTKLSKKEQKKYHALKRGNWGEINPVTKKPPNPKAYKRERIKDIINRNKNL